MDTKHNGTITEFKQIERDGIPVGIVKGYIATWDIDEGNDQFVKGAFKDHLDYYRKEGLHIPMKSNHEIIIGGYPIENVKEDDTGLYGEGEINLELQAGRDAYSLVRQKVFRKKSIGYKAEEKEYKNGIRMITKSKVWEGSILDHPMNLNASVTEVKAFPNEHAARVKEPGTFEEDSFRRKEIAPGISAIMGKIKGESTMTIQSYRFDKSKFTEEEARAWLKDHDITTIEFEAASSGKSISDLQNIGKSDLSKIFRSANLSKDASDFVASLVMSNNLENKKNGKPVDMLNEIERQIKSIQEKIRS